MKLKNKVEISVKVLICPFCNSSRLHFQSCHDDAGVSVAVRCDRCEAEGPKIRTVLSQNENPEMRAEAALAWNQVDVHFIAPDYIELGIGQFRTVRKSRPRPARKQHAIAPTPAAARPHPPAPAAAPEVPAVETLLNKPVPNGLNGHAAAR